MVEYPDKYGKSIWSKLKGIKSTKESSTITTSSEEPGKWKSRIIHWSLGLLVGLLIGLGVSVLAILGPSFSKPFDITVCKVKETMSTGKSFLTNYYLVDEHGTRLSVDSAVWNSLTSIPDCSDTSK